MSLVISKSDSGGSSLTYASLTCPRMRPKISVMGGRTSSNVATMRMLVCKRVYFPRKIIANMFRVTDSLRLFAQSIQLILHYGYDVTKEGKLKKIK